MDEMKIAPMAGAAWGADILTGRKPFPTMQRKNKGFQDILEREIERIEERNDERRKNNGN